MRRDPIVEEVRRVWKAIAAQFNYNVVALGRYCQQLKRESGRTYVSLAPKPKPKCSRKGKPMAKAGKRRKTG